MTFGQKLKELREAAGLTQAQLAAASGVPIGTVRDYEQTRRDPQFSAVQKLARGLGLGIEAFAAVDLPDEAGTAGGAGPPGRGRPRKAAGDQAGPSGEKKGRKRKGG
jgi:transcriptional regulator with XRE-family HTH domain